MWIITIKIFGCALSIFGVSAVSMSVVPCGRMLKPSMPAPPMDEDPSRRPRIVGGLPVPKGQIPWQVAIRKDSQQVCGGAVISPHFVLTTAHCFRQKGRFELSAGIILASEAGQLRSISKTIIHPAWRYGVWENDIALLRVNQSFLFDAYTSPLCIPAHNTQRVRSIFVSGWGRLKEGYRQSPLLRQVAVATASDEQCKRRFPQAFSNRTMFCALSKNKDACHGDSGGAAFNVENGVSVLVGLVSWGRGCARNDTPGVYTKISSFITWINETVSTYGDEIDRAQLAMRPGNST